MIIKGLFRRYERWNPVHPTFGAFWGMGIGIGCGVGWGPGFGPEVIGYVGSGCGVGFSVGITLAGVGIGLPANFLIQIPYNALEGARSGAFKFARSSALPIMKNVAGDGWNNVVPYVSGFNKEARGRLSGFKVDRSFGLGIDLPELHKCVTYHVQSVLESLGAFKDRRLPPREGT
ncbi:cadmium-induced protein AS8 isoform X1 [Magnolia sinica]|uniref:cadmium-induced protein AS8 isoform X1 n=1 Tax=Magnolia sinica TaxID=86752 RepID=UPI002659D46F|nr:cadmium-induced protein AS8 isoform X1 [Magnolia sinica]XP_058071634.1 cadmium-induced protein AS8 isoform X1 [Magnolia sinica]XP_058071635.1 cadmium-induced protein AS8 isoform X1 [Magnolia sinica]